MRLVCSILGVARSHVLELANRPKGWKDRRQATHCRDDRLLLQDIRRVLHELGTYGYRRVWGVLRHQQAWPVNHKTLYRVMRDHGLLLYRHGQRPVSARKHDGKIAVAASNTRWCSDGFEVACDNGERVRVAFALDCCDREVMSWVATRRASMLDW
ncbi:HTH-like domain-containing protein [Noviherbaspirillum humi]|uniref:HTH-like domain-containing protein n=1 Tax=Noviherbaspirillum humi TaxID=1688639 RepID=A0A239M8Z2_9BURK|nr:HTH-like domain-containing protein [Noviherbaspirillum humi]